MSELEINQSSHTQIKAISNDNQGNIQQQPSGMIRFVNKSSGLSKLDIITQNLYSCDVKISDPRVMRAKAVIWSLPEQCYPALGHEAQRDLGNM